MASVNDTQYLIPFGSDANCTLSTCPVELSILTYRPWIPANAVLLAFFAVAGLVHIYLGWRWKSWGFMTGMILGCISEIIGYVGRLMLWYNPFSFAGFMIQIVCLTIAPVFFTASIYVTLSKAITYYAPDLSRFKISLFYWIFIPADVVCLVLQAAGGAISTDSSGSAGVNISMAGLILQVVVLVFFIGFSVDFVVRLLRSGRLAKVDRRFNLFFSGLSAAIVLILARCIFRVDELHEGYGGKLIGEQVPFVILEGVLIVLAVCCLFIGHPGLAFVEGNKARKTSADMEPTSPDDWQ